MTNKYASKKRAKKIWTCVKVILSFSTTSLPMMNLEYLNTSQWDKKSIINVAHKNARMSRSKIKLMFIVFFFISEDCSITSLYHVVITSLASVQSERDFPNIFRFLRLKEPMESMYFETVERIQAAYAATLKDIP